jgi:hypothetical protein
MMWARQGTVAGNSNVKRVSTSFEPVRIVSQNLLAAHVALYSRGSAVSLSNDNLKTKSEIKLNSGLITTQQAYAQTCMC